MDNDDLRDVVDPLSTTTRAERRWLLVSSVVLVALTWGGLIPTKIDALGMEISNINSRVLVWLTCLVTAYFLAAFIFYYRADHFAVGHSAIDTVDTLTDKLVASRANENVGMTKERFGQALALTYLTHLAGASMVIAALHFLRLTAAMVTSLVRGRRSHGEGR